jgi:uncharacterized protein (DUF779 family)
MESFSMNETTSQIKAPEQIVASPKAASLLQKLAAKHGPLLFHHAGGCCNGNSPTCYPEDQFVAEDSDVLIGAVKGAPFYVSLSDFAYWKKTQILLDVAPGMGGMHSLESGEGVRFLVRARSFSDDEVAALRESGRI